MLVGQQYFKDRLGDLYSLAPLPYLAGTGILSEGDENLFVDWELCVAPTGEVILILTTLSDSNFTGTPPGPAREWNLVGTSTTEHYDFRASGITTINYRRTRNIGNDAFSTLYCRVREAWLSKEALTKVNKLTAHLQNLNSKFPLEVSIFCRTIIFQKSEHAKSLLELYQTTRIDRALLSTLDYPLLKDETLHLALHRINDICWFIMGCSLNTVFPPLIELFSNDRPLGWFIQGDLYIEPLSSRDIIDDLHIHLGRKIALESCLDRFIMLDQVLDLKHFIGMMVGTDRQSYIELRLASYVRYNAVK